jgi:hypothetical protein
MLAVSGDRSPVLNWFVHPVQFERSSPSIVETNLLNVIYCRGSPVGVNFECQAALRSTECGRDSFRSCKQNSKEFLDPQYICIFIDLLSADRVMSFHVVDYLLRGQQFYGYWALGGALYIMFENHVRSWPILKNPLYTRGYMSRYLCIHMYSILNICLMKVYVNIFSSKCVYCMYT